MNRIDVNILNLLQTDNQISNANLADKVGLSAPACSRRVARLREDKIIVKDVSILNPQLAGMQLTVIVVVYFAERLQETAELFHQKMSLRPEVLQCYQIAGAVDLLAITTHSDIETYREFTNEVFGREDNVKAYESWFVLSTIKNETKITLEADG